MTADHSSGCDLRKHLAAVFADRPLATFKWHRGPLKSLFTKFEVHRLEPTKTEPGWIFVSDGASEIPAPNGDRHEFVIASAADDPIHIENLAIASHFAADPSYSVYPGKIVDIGRPWMPGSGLDHFLISLPYPFGPSLEYCGQGTSVIRLLWLQPVSRSEAEFAQINGLEALEQLFEARQINYMAADRASVI